MKIRFLGTGSGRARGNRASSAVLFEGNSGALLVDAGEGALQRLTERGHWAQEVRTLLLTHRHADHLAGLPMLIQHWKNSGRKTDLELLASSYLLDALHPWLDALHLAGDSLPFALQCRAVSEGELETGSGHVLHLVDNGHVAAQEGGCFGIRAALGGSTWLHLSDLGNPEAFAKYLESVDGVIVDSEHLDPVDVLTTLQLQSVRWIVLVHRGERDHYPHLPGAIWAEDNMMIDG